MVTERQNAALRSLSVLYFMWIQRTSGLLRAGTASQRSRYSPVSCFGSGHGTHMNLFRQSVADSILRHRKIVVGLKIEPELG